MNYKRKRDAKLRGEKKAENKELKRENLESLEIGGRKGKTGKK